MKLQDALPYMQAGAPFIYDQDDGLYSDEELFEEGYWQYLDTMGYFEYWIEAIKGDKWRIPKEFLPPEA